MKFLYIKKKYVGSGSNCFSRALQISLLKRIQHVIYEYLCRFYEYWTQYKGQTVKFTTFEPSKSSELNRKSAGHSSDMFRVRLYTQYIRSHRSTYRGKVHQIFPLFIFSPKKCHNTSPFVVKMHIYISNVSLPKGRGIGARHCYKYK